MKTLIISDKLGLGDTKSSTAIGNEALARGYTVYECLPGEINYNQGRLQAKARIYTPAPNSQDEEQIDLEKIDVIHFRPNPPVDMAYLTTLYLLNQIKDKVLIINNPDAIITLPEKILPLQFPEFTPPTLISSDIREIHKFAKTHKEIILKPLYDFSGNNIKKFKLAELEQQADSVQNWLDEIKLPLIAQLFLPEICKGDKKIIFLDGEIASAYLRVPAEGSYLANTIKGGVIHKTTITAREKEFAALLKPILKKNGIYFCGIDVISDHITEINITSSGGFTETEKLYGEKLQIKLWDIIESKL